MDYIQIIGYIATFIQITMWIPQFIKVFKHKSIEGVSFFTYWILIPSCYLWLLYSSFIGYSNMAALFANILTLIVITPLSALIFKYKYKQWWIVVPINTAVLAFSFFILFTDILHINKVFEIIIVMVAGLLSSITFLPQAIKTIKEKKIKNFSKILTVSRITTSILWLIYWLIMYIEQERISFLVSSLFTLFAFILMLPILWIGFKGNLTSSNKYDNKYSCKYK